MFFCAIIVNPTSPKFNMKCVFELLGNVRTAQKNKEIKGAQRLYTLDFFIMSRMSLMSCLTWLIINKSKKKTSKPCLFFRIWGGTTTPPHIDELRRIYLQLSIIFFF